MTDNWMIEHLPYLTTDVPPLGGRIKVRPADFQVEDVHTYAVGHAGILVHNKPAPTTLQTGGSTLTNRTRQALGLTKQQAQRGIEGLKREMGLPNNFQGKIMGNGNLVDPNTGRVLGNIYDYVN